MTNFITVSGKPWVEPTTKAAPKPRKTADSFHKGWKVVGHPPGSREEAQNLSQDDSKRWHALPPEEISKRLTSGERAPKEWSEAEWSKTTRKKSVRSKPYGLLEAAHACADLAIRAGWLCVEVIEQKKGNPPNGQI